MDSDVEAVINGFDLAHHNCVHEQIPSIDVDGAIPGGIADESADISGLDAELKNAKLEDDDGPKLSVSTKVKGSKNNEKPSNPKFLTTVLAKKSRDQSGVDGSPKGTAAAKPQQRQPAKSVTTTNGKSNQSKPALESEPEVTETLIDDVKLKPLKKGDVDEPEVEDTLQSLSPTAGDVKPQRVGTLPNYGFSFKCDERAEKRREFYSKLEEKIHAKEVERTNLQAKSKETQEAEIKLLRKSLAFKATPMPSFYQEPAPPKAELKKIPPTRAKSPKLGRKKDWTNAESEESNGITQPNRLSLDENGTRTNPLKSPRSLNLNKPTRRSLPKLPSEKTTLSTGAHKSAVPHQEQEAALPNSESGTGEQES